MLCESSDPVEASLVAVLQRGSQELDIVRFAYGNRELRFAPWCRVAFRSHVSLIAENLFLKKQLAFDPEREIKPRRLTDAARLFLVFFLGKPWERIDFDRFLHRPHGYVSGLVGVGGAGSSPPPGGSLQRDEASDSVLDRAADG